MIIAVEETLAPNSEASRGSMGSTTRRAMPPLALASARRKIISRTGLSFRALRCAQG
jgi:hypothetical protein